MANFMRDQRGQDMTEYALLAGLVAAVAVAIVPELVAISGSLEKVLQSITQAVIQMASLE